MSRPKRARRPQAKRASRSSTWVLAATQRSRLSWTSWSLTRALRAEKRAQARLLLLQLEMDHQLLRQKELEQRRLQLLHRQAEMAEARSFRTSPLLPAPPSQRQEMDRLLGL